MKKVATTISLCFFGAIWLINPAFAQEKTEESPAAYTRVITQRANKIALKLDLTDTLKVNKVTAIIADQYRQLGIIHDLRNNQIKALKKDSTLSKEVIAAKVAGLEKVADVKLKKQHAIYLSKLGRVLSAEQIDKVKDGMTFGVLPATYKGYLEMLPMLTEKQKAQILAYLTEARELAIDAESAEKKHATFGKYKGRINNYLSAEGIETKKAREIWEQKLKERQSKG